jgi:uncharacterized protein (DUF952 family)
VAEHIFHCAPVEDWAAAQESGRYEHSTRGRSLADEGFIHASTAQQLPGVLARFYADYPEDLVVLEIDPDRLDVPLVYEVGDPATGERFPHLYGPLDPAAVVGTRVLHPPHGRSSREG